MYKKNKSADSCYSLHTLELSINLTYEKYNLYRNILYEYCIQNKHKMYSPESNTYCYDLSKNHITRLAMKKNTNAQHDYCYYTLTLIINPRVLLGYQKNIYVCIVPPEQTGLIIPTLQEKLSQIGLHIPTQALKISRLDFCTNIKLDDNSLFDTYWKLLCKGRHIYNSTQYKIYNKQQKRKVAPPYSFTLCGSSFIFQIYSKEHEMLSSAFSFQDDEISSAHNQIRIELRYFSYKLSKLTAKHSDINDFMGNLPHHSKHYISKYLNALYGKGNFLRFDLAVNLIENSHFHAHTQKALIKFMKKCSKSSFENACQEYKNKYYNLDYIIKCFNKINLSPITLPIRSPYTELPHPCQYILTHNMNNDV